MMIPLTRKSEGIFIFRILMELFGNSTLSHTLSVSKELFENWMQRWMQTAKATEIDIFLQ